MSVRIITREELNMYLWGAAGILRGTADASDYKNYIFGMLFLKRLSDVFYERREEVVQHYVEEGQSREDAERIADTDPDEYVDGSFFIPEQARWRSLMKVSENRAETLDKACLAIEAQNSRYLEGVLGDIHFNSNRLAGDPAELDGLIQRLMNHFDRMPLGNRNLSEPDLLGNAYEYLIERFAETAGKKGGEFYTPRAVVQLIVELLQPREGMRICDPTAGSGGMLIECARYVDAHGGDPRNLTLFGQEKNVGTWSICKMNMLLHNIPDADIRKGDTIRTPKLTSNGRLMTFDRVIANPPFSLADWGHETAEKDPFKRFHRGLPPKTKGDTAFLQHMVETCGERGMVGVVMPHGVLFRGAGEAQVRRSLVEEDLVEAVIGLPAKLFFGTGIPTAVVILNKAKPAERRGKVLFVDASAEGFYRESVNQNHLQLEDVIRVAAVFRAFGNPEKVGPAVESIRDAWIRFIDHHTERQLGKAQDDPDARERILKEGNARTKSYKAAAENVLDWASTAGSLERFASVATQDEIVKEHDCNLNITRYVDNAASSVELDARAELKTLAALIAKRDEAETRFQGLVRELGYEL